MVGLRERVLVVASSERSKGLILCKYFYAHLLPSSGSSQLCMEWILVIGAFGEL